MQRTRGQLRPLLLALFCVAPLLASGCDIISPGGSTRVVQVDSVTVLADQTTATSIPVRFWGYVGSNGCSSLNTIERSVWPDSMLIRFVAETKNSLCTQMPVPLEHVETITPGASDVFTVIVRQPDQSRLRERVPVR